MGTVYFVGAGPGDPELLTIKGKRLIESADVIIYDRLVHPLLLQLSKKSALLLFSGKYPKNHVMKQKTINQLLIDESQKVQTVVRLKGGDSGIFGRVGEEIDALREKSIPYEVVPGITAASAAASYSGIPLTHRDKSSKVTFITAHRQQEEKIDYQGLTNNGTICLYMGLEQIKKTSQLLLARLSESIPVVIVEWGSLGRQRTFTATIKTMSDVVARHQLTNPSLIIIGKIVTCRNGCDWFEKLPLYGEKLLFIDTKSTSFEQLLPFIQQGADVYSIQVGDQREERFDEVHKRYLKDHHYDKLIYLDDTIKKQFATQKELLEKQFACTKIKN